MDESCAKRLRGVSEELSARSRVRRRRLRYQRPRSIEDVGTAVVHTSFDSGAMVPTRYCLGMDKSTDRADLFWAHPSTADSLAFA